MRQTTFLDNFPASIIVLLQIPGSTLVNRLHRESFFTHAFYVLYSTKHKGLLNKDVFKTYFVLYYTLL